MEAKTEVRTVRAGNVEVGAPGTLALIGGPCVIESADHALRHAEKIAAIASALDVPFIFKASYDKANRTSVDSYRGPGLEEGLKVLRRVKEELGLPVLSDVHSIEQVGPAAEVLDVLQIPAFLCRQTDLLLAAGKTGRAVNVKKGQFMSPWDMANVVGKLEHSGCRDILLTDRGTSFGYQNLVSDFRAVPVMRSTGFPVVFDATHSVQLPGGKGTASGGMAEFIPTLAACAVAAGSDAVFMEIHEDPARALSDGPNNLKLEDLRGLLEKLLRIKRALNPEKDRESV